MPNRICKTKDCKTPTVRHGCIRDYQPVNEQQKNHQTISEPPEIRMNWLCRFFVWVGSLRKTEQQRRFARIAKTREQISSLFTCKVPKKELDIDYSQYERIASSDDIQQGIPWDHMVTDENNVTYVDQAYVSRLLENIAQGRSSPIRLPKQEVPNIIGLWADEILDSWTRQPKRLDTEEEYFSCRLHSMNSYIDDSWLDGDRKKVWRYLRSHKQKPDKSINIVVGHPHSQSVGDYRICTDGKYFWHESLEDLIIKYNVRPPAFFVDYILKREGSEAEDSA